MAGEGAATVMEDIGEVGPGTLDLGIGGAFTGQDLGVTVFTDPDCGGMDPIGEAIILITEVIRIPVMDT